MAFKIAVLLLFLASSLAEDIDYIETLDDHYDATKVHINETKQIMDCLIDKGPCSDLASSYKQHWPEVMEVVCAKCSKVQKKSLKKFFNIVIKDLPEEFKVFLQKYDPDKKHWDTFYADLQNA